MYGIKRIMDDSDGDHMEGYLTEQGEYGTLAEACQYTNYDEASNDLDNEKEKYHREFPEDDNSFEIVELY